MKYLREIITSLAIVFVTCMATNNLAGFIYTVPLLTIVLFLHLVYMTDFLKRDSFYIAVAVSVVYNGICFVLNYNYLNWYMSENSEFANLIMLGFAGYILLFKPAIHVLTKKV